MPVTLCQPASRAQRGRRQEVGSLMLKTLKRMVARTSGRQPARPTCPAVPSPLWRRSLPVALKGGGATLELHFVPPGFRPKSPICNLISETAFPTLPRPPYAIGRSTAWAVRRALCRRYLRAVCGAKGRADAWRILEPDGQATQLRVLQDFAQASGRRVARGPSMADGLANGVGNPERNTVAGRMAS